MQSNTPVREYIPPHGRINKLREALRECLEHKHMYQIKRTINKALEEDDKSGY